MSHFLKIYRDAYDITQVELARHLGISPGHLCMMEMGTRNLTGKAAEKFRKMQSRETAFPIEQFGTMEEAVINILESYKSESKQNLSDREGNLIFKLHNLNKSIRDLKDQYNRAKHEIRYLLILSANFNEGEMPVTLQNKCVADRFKADTALRAVLNRKPELMMAEVQGILAELKYIKNLRKNPGQIFDSATDSFLSVPPTQLSASENKVDSESTSQ